MDEKWKRARQLRRASTDAERHLWRHLRRGNMAAYKFRRQFPIAAYIVDFACLSAMLVVEVDGGQHLAAQGYDAVRTRRLEANGYRVLRFWNDEVLLQTEAVLEVIWRSLLSR
jgi:very-short-patch-repair endonuclease